MLHRTTDRLPAIILTSHGKKRPSSETRRQDRVRFLLHRTQRRSQYHRVWLRNLFPQKPVTLELHPIGIGSTFQNLSATAAELGGTPCPFERFVEDVSLPSEQCLHF